MSGRRPGLEHLWRLSDARAVIEHARGREPAREHGYCVDDVARALVLLSRMDALCPTATDMASRYLRFVLDAVAEDGAVHNRMSVDGVWQDTPGVGDWWGRAVWGLGVTACCNPSARLREQASEGFARAAAARSPWLHACAFAVLGAAPVARRDGPASAAGALVRDCLRRVGVRPGPSARWPWPEGRLRYASGAVPEALMLAGESSGRSDVVAQGLALLRFLLELCEHAGRLSPPPAAGRGPDDGTGGENQQPIEVAAIADACATALRLTGDERWRDGVRRCWDWFSGVNDFEVCMVDWSSGGGYDGLRSTGPNPNQGAESTIAMLTTAHQADRLGLLRDR